MVIQLIVIIAVVASVVYKWCVKGTPVTHWKDSYLPGAAPTWAAQLGTECAYVTWKGISASDWTWVGPRIQTTIAATEMLPTLSRYFPSIKESSAGELTMVQAALCVYYTNMITGSTISPKDAVAHACSVYFVADFRTSPSEFAAAVANKNANLFNDRLPALLVDMLQPFRDQFHISAVPKKAFPPPP